MKQITHRNLQNHLHNKIANRSIPKNWQSQHMNQPTTNQFDTIKTWSLDNASSKNHV